MFVCMLTEYLLLCNPEVHECFVLLTVDNNIVIEYTIHDVIAFVNVCVCMCAHTHALQHKRV